MLTWLNSWNAGARPGVGGAAGDGARSFEDDGGDSSAPGATAAGSDGSPQDGAFEVVSAGLESLTPSGPAGRSAGLIADSDATPPGTAAAGGPTTGESVPPTVDAFASGSAPCARAAMEAIAKSIPRLAANTCSMRTGE